MQTHGGQAAEDAILGDERHITPRLLIDWDRDGGFGHALSDMSGYIKSVRTDRSLTGSAPDEITLIEGSAAAELATTVAGMYGDLSLVQVFSPYNGYSPLYRQDLIGCAVSYSLIVHTAVGEVEYPQFQGVVRSAFPDRATGEVEIKCLDRVELLRKPINLVPWAISESHVRQNGEVRAQLCDSQAVIDMALRPCDVSPTGTRPVKKYELGLGQDALDGVHFWLTGTGTHAPMIGWMDNSNAQSFPDTEDGEPEMYWGTAPKHPELSDADPTPLAFNSLGDAGQVSGSNGVTKKYWVLDRDMFNSVGTYYLRAVLNFGGSNPNYSDIADTTILRVRIGTGRRVELRIVNGQAYTAYVNENPDPDAVFESALISLPTGVDHVEIFAQWDNTDGSGTRSYLRVGDVDSGWVSEGPPHDGTGSTDNLKGLVEVNTRVSLSDIVFASRNIYNGSADDTASVYRSTPYAAALDPGRNRMTYLPTRRGVDAWDIIADVANAEFGSVFWDESGVFRFWTYDTILAKQDSPVRTITIDDTSALGVERSIDSVRNIWSVETSKRAASIGLAYESDSVDEFIVPPNTTSLFRLWVDDVQMVNPFDLQQHDTRGASNSGFPQWGDHVISGFVPSWLRNGVWEEDPNVIKSSPRCWFDVEGYLVVRISNGTSDYVRMATQNGRPALRIDGTRIVERGTLVNVQRYQDSIDRHDERNIRLSGDWYQDEFQSVNMLDAVAERATSPIPAAEKITIPGDPRTQLGDALTITDPGGLGGQIHSQTFGITREWSVDGGLTDDYRIEITRPPRSIWSSTEYGRWNETLIWG